MHKFRLFYLYFFLISQQLWGYKFQIPFQMAQGEAAPVSMVSSAGGATFRRRRSGDPAGPAARRAVESADNVSDREPADMVEDLRFGAASRAAGAVLQRGGGGGRRAAAAGGGAVPQPAERPGS